MIYTIFIDGIGCAQCEQRIRKALKKLDDVTVLQVSKDKNCAVISTETEISNQTISNTVHNAHTDGRYTVSRIEIEENTCCLSGKHKERDEKERKDLMNRLKRIEGQVRGIEKMLDDGVYCTDIVTQVAAVGAALNSFNRVLLANHMRTCVLDNIRNGNDEVIDELVALFQKLMK